MEDLFKKFVYTGVGIVSETAEKVQQSIDELIEKGKITEDEGKKVVENVMADTKTKREDFESKLKGMIDTVLGQFDFPSRSEVESLNAKIAALEAKVAASTKKTPAKKVAAKA